MIMDHVLREANLSPGDPIDWSDLVEADSSGFLKRQPNEPTGGTCVVNSVGVDPACSFYSGGSWSFADGRLRLMLCHPGGGTWI